MVKNGGKIVAPVSVQRWALTSDMDGLLDFLLTSTDSLSRILTPSQSIWLGEKFKLCRLPFLLTVVIFLVRMISNQFK